jgi:hypothetical protein
MIREVDNYYFYIRQVEMLNDTSVLKAYKVKMGDKHNIYGAINIPPELMIYYKDLVLEQNEKTIFGQEIAKLNDVLVNAQLMELYTMTYERVKDEDYYAYVFNIRYKWEACTPSAIITYSAVTLGAVVALVWLIASHWPF